MKINTTHYLSLTFMVASMFFFSCKNHKTVDNQQTTSEPAALNYQVIGTFPHDTSYFTEGYEWHEGQLFESTGLYGKSKLVKTDWKTGTPLQSISLDKAFFGEGITMLNGKIYQLTYQEKKCFVYDQKTFQKIASFNYDGEGWGLTNNGKELIMDNGGSFLYYRDPVSFAITDSISVNDNNGPLSNINELEYVNGFIYANVYTTNYIVKIDPHTGKVISRADLSDLIIKELPEMATQQALDAGSVLNGIAYNPERKTFFITGKLWPKVFEVRFL